MSSKIAKNHKVLFGALLAIAVIIVLVYFILPSPSSEPSKSKEVPDAMKELAQNESVAWMAGIWVDLPNYEMLQSDSTSGIDVYSCTDSTIQATVTVQNGLNKTQSYFLMVLADGVPVEYKIGENTYQTYQIELTAEQQTMNLELCLDFSLHMGRLDFLLFYDENPKSDYHMTTYTVWIVQEEKELQPSLLLGTVEQRAGIKGRFSDGTYGAWFWNEGALPAEDDQTGPHEITVGQGETLLLEAVTSGQGLYRTIIMLGGKPISFIVEGKEYNWVDWEANGENMLQIPIKLPENLTASGSFFTITTPLGIDAISRYNLASFKIQVMNSQEREE